MAFPFITAIAKFIEQMLRHQEHGFGGLGRAPQCAAKRDTADFGAAMYGPAFTVETGMKNPMADRVALQKLTVQTAVDVFSTEEPARRPPGADIWKEPWR